MEVQSSLLGRLWRTFGLLLRLIPGVGKFTAASIRPWLAGVFAVSIVASSVQMRWPGMLGKPEGWFWKPFLVNPQVYLPRMNRNLYAVDQNVGARKSSSHRLHFGIYSQHGLLCPTTPRTVSGKRPGKPDVRKSSCKCRAEASIDRCSAIRFRSQPTSARTGYPARPWNCQPFRRGTSEVSRSPVTLEGVGCACPGRSDLGSRRPNRAYHASIPRAVPRKSDDHRRFAPNRITRVGGPLYPARSGPNCRDGHPFGAICSIGSLPFSLYEASTRDLGGY
jgi:hypothetical protein